MSFTTLLRVTPERVMVAANGQARLRVEGSVHGSLRVGGERRWVWGPFDETFVVAVSAPEPIKIVLSGIGGRATHHVPCDPLRGVHCPRINAIEHRMPSVPTMRRLPAIRRLATHHFSAPSLLRLSNARPQSTSHHTVNQP